MGRRVSRIRVWRELRIKRLNTERLLRQGLMPKPAQQCARNGTEAVTGGIKSMSQAAIGRAGTLASVAAIPYVGRALAPEAAAAAFADVEGMS